MYGAARGSAGCVEQAEPQHAWPDSAAAPSAGAEVEGETWRGASKGEGRRLRLGSEVQEDGEGNVEPQQ